MHLLFPDPDLKNFNSKQHDPFLQFLPWLDKLLSRQCCKFHQQRNWIENLNNAYILLGICIRCMMLWSRSRSSSLSHFAILHLDILGLIYFALDVFVFHLCTNVLSLKHVKGLKFSLAWELANELISHSFLSTYWKKTQGVRERYCMPRIANSRGQSNELPCFLKSPFL